MQCAACSCCWSPYAITYASLHLHHSLSSASRQPPGGEATSYSTHPTVTSHATPACSSSPVCPSIMPMPPLPLFSSAAPCKQGKPSMTPGRLGNGRVCLCHSNKMQEAAAAAPPPHGCSCALGIDKATMRECRAPAEACWGDTAVLTAVLLTAVLLTAVHTARAARVAYPHHPRCRMHYCCRCDLCAHAAPALP